MRIQSLHIARAASYETNPGQLRGSVELAGPTGTQTTTLSPTAILRIFEVIAQEVRATTLANAQTVSNAFEDVRSENLLLEHTINDDEIPF